MWILFCEIKMEISIYSQFKTYMIYPCSLDTTTNNETIHLTNISWIFINPMTIRLFLTKNQLNTNKQTELVKLVGQEINVISDL